MVDADAQAILIAYEGLAAAGQMATRKSLMIQTGLSYPQFLEAHRYMVRNLLVPAELAVRYSTQQHLWTAGAERYNGAAGYDESKDYIRFHTSYIHSRSVTELAHISSIAAAFPAKKRALRPYRVRAESLVLDSELLLAAL